MKSKNFKISFLVSIILLVFLNPLVINSFHTLEDHVPHHHCCKNNSPQLIVDLQNEFCPIHEYEFSINDLPDSGSKEYSDSDFTEMIVSRVNEVSLEIYSNQSSPRAPPHFPFFQRG